MTRNIKPASLWYHFRAPADGAPGSALGRASTEGRGRASRAIHLAGKSKGQA